MLSLSQKLTDGLIIFSVLVSDYERLDFKNDALAGVRANYYNSSNSVQSDKTEVYLNNTLYNLSYNMNTDSSLSWKVTRNNRPYQSVKKETGGVYCVMFYEENGIIFKRIYFDNKHNWLRTEYFDRYYDNVLICRIYPKTIFGVVALQIEKYSDNGSKSIEQLFPSSKAPSCKCAALVYSNVGMLWYDASFRPADMPLKEEKTEKRSGFEFKPEYFSSSSTNGDIFDLSSVEYLKDSDIPEIPAEKTKNADKTYSAYDKIERILTEAHKSNKDLFGEIINLTSNEEYLTDKPNNNENDSDEVFESENSQEENKAAITVEKEGKNVIVNPHTDTNTEDNYMSGNDNSVNINFDERSNDNNYEISHESQCDIEIETKSGKYTYYGNLDENRCRTGRGRTVTPDGFTSYDGEYKNDKRDGFGVCYYRNGCINFVGQWSDNNRNGCGVGYRLSDGTMHIGKWNCNSPDGYGARFDSEGNFLDVCQYNNGIRNGKSVSFDENGNIIVCEWKDGEKISEKIIDTYNDIEAD